MFYWCFRKNPGETPPPGIEKVHRYGIGNLNWLGLNWIEVIIIIIIIIMSLKFVTLLEKSSLTYESININKYIYIYMCPEIETIWDTAWVETSKNNNKNIQIVCVCLFFFWGGRGLLFWKSDIGWESWVTFEVNIAIISEILRKNNSSQIKSVLDST